MTVHVCLIRALLCIPPALTTVSDAHYSDSVDSITVDRSVTPCRLANILAFRRNVLLYLQGREAWRWHVCQKH